MRTTRKTSVKFDLTWNKIQEELYNKAKSLIKKEACMQFYNEKELLQLETDAPGVNLEMAW